jgi:uncharacterized protein
MPPTLANGKICFIQIPATDSVFGWKIRERADGRIAFDDGAGEVSGEWVLDRPPAAQPGLLVYIMVDSVATTLEAIVAKGGEIVLPVGADAPEITARFQDPSVRSLSVAGSVKSAILSFMSVAVSPLPSPSLPWHMTQSMLHHFLARASDSGLDFTGLASRAASTGIEA